MGEPHALVAGGSGMLAGLCVVLAAAGLLDMSRPRTAHDQVAAAATASVRG